MNDELKNQLKEFNKQMSWDQFHTPENLAKSIAIESAELLECFQWNSEYILDDVTEEMADVYSYLVMLADKVDVDLEEIALKKLEVTRQKYPKEKFAGISTKYNKLED
jgi:dCTP diphosphatase